MLIRRAEIIKSSEISKRDLFLRRREFLRGAGWTAAGAVLAPTLACGAESEVPTLAPSAGHVELEGRALMGLSRRLVAHLTPGEEISVTFRPMRDGSLGGELESVTLPDGQTLR